MVVVDSLIEASSLIKPPLFKSLGLPDAIRVDMHRYTLQTSIESVSIYVMSTLYQSLTPTRWWGISGHPPFSTERKLEVHADSRVLSAIGGNPAVLFPASAIK